MLHCHISVHSERGMMTVIDVLEDIKQNECLINSELIEDINLMSGCIENLEEELRKQFRTQFYKDQEATKEVEQ